MKKRLFSILLALALCLTLLPAAALADTLELPALLEIHGKDAASIPGTAQYSVYGKLTENEYLPLKDNLIHWSIENAPVTGVSIGEQSGILTISKATASGTVTIRVTYGNPSGEHVSASKLVTLTGAEAPAALTITGKPDSVIYGDTFTLTATVEQAEAGGSWRWESSEGGLFELTAQSGGPSILALSATEHVTDTCTVKALKPGSAKITATYTYNDTPVSSSVEIRADRRPLTVKADDKTMTAGDALPEFTVRYTGFADGDDADTVFETKAAASAETDGKTAGSYAIAVTAPTLRSARAEYYEIRTENGTLTVTAPSSGGSSGGSSSGSSGVKTEVTQNADGSTTRTETRADGTVTVTTTYPDGSTVKTVTRPDGSSTTERRSPDGSVGTLRKDANGQTTGSARVSEKALEDAKKNDSAVKIPLEVAGASNSTSAATIRIDLPNGAGETKVEIPVSGMSSGMVIVIVHEDGTEEILKTCKSTEDGLQFSATDGMQIKVIDNSKDFSDSRDHWSKDGINYVSARDLLVGTGGGNFGVNQPTSRGTIDTILARLAGVDTTPSDGGKWYEVGVNWAKTNGITDGTDPTSTVSREELAAMLYRFSGSPKVSGNLLFRDVGQISPYAQDAMLWAVQNNILNGVGNAHIAPGATATRAQVAAIMARYLQNLS